MDEDRRDNNNERVVVEKERSSLGPIIALIVIVLILIIGFLAFQSGNDTADETLNVPETIDVNVDNPVQGEQ